jgi:hypothetical protein
VQGVLGTGSADAGTPCLAVPDQRASSREVGGPADRCYTCRDHALRFRDPEVRRAFARGQPMRQNFPFCAPSTDRPEGTLPVQIGGSACQPATALITEGDVEPGRLGIWSGARPDTSGGIAGTMNDHAGPHKHVQAQRPQIGCLLTCPRTGAWQGSSGHPARRSRFGCPRRSCGSVLACAGRVRPAGPAGLGRQGA